MAENIGEETGEGLDAETLELTLEAVRDFAEQHLPKEVLLDLDARDEFPLEIIREMCGSGLGIQLLFIPERYGGMGGGAFDVCRVCEQMGRIDLGVATGVLATFLGADPIVYGGTESQQELWLGRIAEEGLLMAYCATEPEAGSDLAAMRSTAAPVEENGRTVGYRISGSKQWISNGAYADLYSVLARAPGGPSWFVVEKGVDGLQPGRPEEKHGIRASNTSAVSFDEVYVDADRLLGEVEGEGLAQAQAVFGYTRLMVAAFGLGAGWEAIDRAIPYSADRIQAGAPLSEKQGYTHKLIVPWVVRLEASRAYIEETAERIDAGEGSLITEGAIAKYLATEYGNLAAEAGIQALGGYGYTREYMVEKIKRDVRITTIYEGTSEIMEMTIGRDRWQFHLKTRGQHYHELAAGAEALDRTNPGLGADIAALGLHALAEILERCRVGRLTRHQHVLLRIGELIAWAECTATFARRAGRAANGTLGSKAERRFDAPTLAAMSRIFAREAALKVATDGMQWVAGALGSGELDVAGFDAAMRLDTIRAAQAGMIADMDAVADVLYGRAGA